MTAEQWSQYRALRNDAREVYRAARLSGVKHKHAMKRAKKAVAPVQHRRVARMAAVAHPLGV